MLDGMKIIYSEEERKRKGHCHILFAHENITNSIFNRVIDILFFFVNVCTRDRLTIN
jgi:hypothetical protein